MKSSSNSVPFFIRDEAKAKEFFRDYEEFQKFQMHSAANLYEKAFALANSGTALYEKVVLLNGAAFALSVTFLGALATRFTAIHTESKPHLWIIAISWCLLIVSTYSCYRTIVDRHSAMHRMLAVLSKSNAEYIYQRLGVLINRMSALISGHVTVGSQNIDISTLSATLGPELKAEGESQLKRIDQLVAEGNKNHHEGVFAMTAIVSTILAVLFLCIFTLLSLRLLF